MSSDTGAKIEQLIEIVTRLRSPNGCPWDKKQTPSSFKSYLLEETHELVEAIESENATSIKEELGDVFFQLVFLCRIYEENKEFTAADAIDSICEKMVRRHPHVFGDTKIKNIEDQKQLWLSIKAQEKDNCEQKSSHFLDAVPTTLPALRRAQRVIERAAHAGFKWPNEEMIIEKLAEETNELQEAISTGDKEKIFEELGDLLFTTVNLGKFLETNAEDALKSSTAKFIKRFTSLQEFLEKDNQAIPDASIKQLLSAWEKVKNR